MVRKIIRKILPQERIAQKTNLQKRAMRRGFFDEARTPSPGRAWKIVQSVSRRIRFTPVLVDPCNDDGTARQTATVHDVRHEPDDGEQQEEAGHDAHQDEQ
jgi:hypothetical protein